MKHALLLSLALALTPAAAFAQSGPPPDAPGATAPTAAQMAAMQQWRAVMEQNRVQTRSRILASLTPQHRAAVANIIGQLALTPNPDPRVAVQSLDAILAPSEKQSILNVDAAARANMRALMQQHEAQMAATMSADQRAVMTQRQAKMQSWRASHPHTYTPDAGAVVLRTLGSFGGPGGHGRPM